jgi:TrbL/VirB6 plasmid conjugal transfer protein
LKVWQKKHYSKIALAVVGVILLDGLFGGAMAQMFSLFLGGAPSCPAPSLDRIFSGFLCEYEKLLDNIMNVVYTGILSLMNAPFFAFLTLFVVCTGVLFATGVLPFSLRDFMLIFFKVLLVMVFATNPNFLIGYLYVGVVSFAQGTTDAVLQILAPTQGSIQGIFSWIDNIFFQFLQSQGANATADPANNSAVCNNNLLALLFGLAVTMPPVFGIAAYVVLQMAFAFFKTIMSYVIAMTGIMFLTAIAPLFLMFALFKFTSEYFESWLRYLVGFAIQIFVVFAVVGVVINWISSPAVTDRVNTVLAMVQPYDKTIQHDGHRLDFNGWCTLCIQAPGGGARPAACGGQALSPSALQTGGTTDFLNYIGSDLFYLGLMAYLMNILLTTAPELARSFVSMFGAPQYSGELPLSNPMARDQQQDALRQSLKNSKNSTTGATGSNGFKAENVLAKLMGNRTNVR